MKTRDQSRLAQGGAGATKPVRVAGARKHRVPKMALAALTAIMSGMPAMAAQAATTTVSTSTSATLTASIATLATQIAALAAKTHDGGLAEQLSAPVLKILTSGSFDWNEVLFGTDTLSAWQQQTATALTPDLVALVTEQDTTQAQAVTLVTGIIAAMQSINPAVQPSDVVAYLNTVVSDAPSEIFYLIGLPTLTPTIAAQNLHSAIASYVAQASPAIQTLFAADGTPGSVSVSAGAQGTSGESSGAGAGSTGSGSGQASAGSGASAGVSGSAGSGSDSGAGGTAEGNGSAGAGSSSGGSVSSQGGNAFAGALLQEAISAAGGDWQVALSGIGSLGIQVPAGALVSGSTLRVDTYALPTGLTLPAHAQVVSAFNLQFNQAKTSAGKPVTLTLLDRSIARGTLIYTVTAHGLAPFVGAHVLPGRLSLSPQSQAILLLQAPVVDAPTFPATLPSMKKNQRALDLDGKVRAFIPSLVVHGTTYMPIAYVMQALQTLGVRSSWQAGVWTMTPPASLPVSLSNLAAGHGTDAIAFGSQTVLRLPGIVALDATTHTYTTFMPIALVMQALARLTMVSAWNGRVWAIATP